MEHAKKPNGKNVEMDFMPGRIRAVIVTGSTTRATNRQRIELAVVSARYLELLPLHLHLIGVENAHQD